MNNLIGQISLAVKQPRRIHQHWSVQIVIALSFAAIAIGYSIYGSLNITQAAESETIYQIVHPTGGDLRVGEEVTVGWTTDLTGPVKLLVEVEDPSGGTNCQVIDGSSHCRISEEIQIQAKSFIWKVGYTKDPSTGEWVKMNSELFGKTAHFYLMYFPQWSWPDHYDFGYDKDPNTPDQQPPFTMVDVASVDINPSSAIVMAGVPKQFTAQAYDTNGQISADSTDDPTGFTWVGTNATGLFQEDTAGTYHVSVTYADRTDAAVVTVAPAHAATLRLLPPNKTVSVGTDFDLGLQLETDDTVEVVGVDLMLEFPENYISAAAIDNYFTLSPELSSLGWIILGSHYDPTGPNRQIIISIGMTGYSPNDVINGVQTIGTIHLKALSVTSAGAPAPVNFVVTGEDGDHSTRVAAMPGISILDEWHDSLISIVEPPQLSGIYHSRTIPFDAANPGLGLSSLGDFTLKAFWDDSLNTNGAIKSQVKVGVKFLGATDNPLGFLNGDGTMGHYEYRLVIDSNPNGAVIPAEEINAMFKQYGWFKDIRKVQFVIEMSTADTISSDAAYKPWVEAVSLGYEMQGSNIGAIQFIPNDNSGSRKDINNGATIDFDLKAIPTSDLGDDSVTVKFDVDWNGAGAGNGNPPDGIALQLIPENGLIYEFNNYSTDANRYAFKLRLTSSAEVKDAADYNFSVTGTAVGETGRDLTAAAGILRVNGGVSTTGDIELSFVGENGDNKTFKQGDTANYGIRVTSRNGFSAPVTLDTNISTQVSGIDFPDWIPADVVTPPANGAANVELRALINPNADDQSNVLFTVTATANNGDAHDEIIGKITIDADAAERPAITIIAHVPMETTRTSTQPTFYLRLYPDNATGRAGFAYQLLDILPTEFNDDDVITIEVPSGNVLDGHKYDGYIKSTRHLWAKSSNSFTINSATTDQSYNLTFPTLVAGNAGPVSTATQFLEDDVINSIDWTVWFSEAAGVWSSLFADFDNNGSVNMPDLNYILGNYGANWFKKGALETRWPQS